LDEFLDDFPTVTREAAVSALELDVGAGHARPAPREKQGYRKNR
jgi:hypothetical protein